jgi:hypothetical protein
MKKPHVLADPTSASAANNKTLSDFFTAVGQQSVANVLALFSLDIGNPPTIPGVGITSHGPNFEGHADITVLFTRLFASFPDLTLKELNNAASLFPQQLHRSGDLRRSDNTQRYVPKCLVCEAGRCTRHPIALLKAAFGRCPSEWELSKGIDPSILRLFARRQ